MKPPCPTCGRAYKVPQAEKLSDVDIARVATMLARPGRKPYGDDFYRAIAAVRTEYAQVSAPSTLIARALDVPLPSVHGWVKEARRRGFLPPGHKGSPRL